MGNTQSHSRSSRSKPLSTRNDLPPPYTSHNDTSLTSSRPSSSLSQQPSRGSSSGYSDTKLASPIETFNDGPSRNPFLSPMPQSPQTTSTRRASHTNSVSLSDREDQLQLLQRFDTVIVVDDSSSMQGHLWYEARDALAGIAALAARYDANGLDIHFLNSRFVGTNLRSAAEVERIFATVRPRGITPTGRKLEELLLDYLLRYEGSTQKPKPVNFLILTDGAPSDDPLSVIVTAAKRLDAQNAPLSQVGIQFVQLGADPQATEALREMDNDLSTDYNIRDIVDTTPYTGQALNPDLLAKILLGGINRRVDRISYRN